MQYWKSWKNFCLKANIIIIYQINWNKKKITKAVAEPENAVAKYIKDCSKVVLRKGAKGKVVELLQKLLVAQGYKLTWHKTRSGIDGDFGRMTDRAVRRFQKDEGLVADGIVGKNTWAALTD